MDNNEVVTEEVAAVVENNTGIEIEPLFEEQVDFDTFSKSDFRVVKVKNCEAVPKSKKLLRFTLDDGTENERTILSGVHAFYEPEELVAKNGQYRHRNDHHNTKHSQLVLFHPLLAGLPVSKADPVNIFLIPGFLRQIC